MPLDNVIVPAFPNVPAAAGVPAVLRPSGAPALGNAVLLASDVASVIGLFLGPQWGIFDATGAPVLAADSVLAVDFRKEWRVSDYPLEGGSFASYDRIEMPFDIRVTFAVSGAGSLLSSLVPGGALLSLLPGFSQAAARTAVLTALATAAANPPGATSLPVYSVVTPEVSYPSCSIVHYDYRREARGGATLIRIDVWLAEARIAPPPQFSQTTAASGADPVNTGPVQATPPTTPAAAAPAGLTATGTATGGTGAAAVSTGPLPGASGGEGFT